MNKGLRIFGLITSIGVLIVLLQGALVTQTGSEAGCGATWPLCFGEVIPTNPAIETIIEYSHRTVSGLVGAMIIVLAIWSWKKLSHIKETKVLSILAVFLIIFQGLLGAGAVVFGQSDVILALHFGVSAMSVASVFLLTMLSFENHFVNRIIVNVSKAYKRYFLFTIIFCYAVIYTGAYVKHVEATLACRGFPLCNGLLFPGLAGPVGAHFFHRLAGTSLLIVLFILMIWTIRKFRHERVLVISSVAAFLLTIVQFISGASVVLTENEFLSLGLLHALFITIVFAILSYMGLILLRKKSTSHI